MHTHKHFVIYLHSIAALTLGPIGCGEPSETLVVEGQSYEIIGGFPAESPALDAIGVVGSMSLTASGPTGPISANCTGTLIDEDTVVTAKHCIRSFATLGSQNRAMVFAIGSDVRQPKQWASVVAVEGAPGDTGGFVTMGHDVAVLQLDKPLTGVMFAKLGSLSDDQLDQAFVSIGYGMRDNNQQYGQRLVGTGRLKALQGRTLEVLFGSFDAYFENAYGIKPSDCPTGAAGSPALPPVVGPVGGGPAPAPVTIIGANPCSQLNALRKEYDSELLETNDEVVVSVEEGDAQPCKGDSGGPLIQQSDSGELVTYGVVSGGERSKALVCDYGTVYASFIDADVMQFVEQAKGWTDPCAGLSAAGTCEGSVAQRCSTAAEGQRRIVAFDCQNVGLGCVVQESGVAGCF